MDGERLASCACQSLKPASNMAATSGGCCLWITLALLKKVRACVNSFYAIARKSPTGRIPPRIPAGRLSNQVMKRTKLKRSSAKPLTDVGLDRMLWAAKVPARSRGYWQQFPKRVRAALPKAVKPSSES